MFFCQFANQEFHRDTNGPLNPLKCSLLSAGRCSVTPLDSGSIQQRLMVHKRIGLRSTNIILLTRMDGSSMQ